MHILYPASQLFNSCYIFINKTSLSQTHKPYFILDNKNPSTALKKKRGELLGDIFHLCRTKQNKNRGTHVT